MGSHIYKYVFCKIDEKPFAVLYSDTERPNFPVNIALSLEYIKHLKNYSDDELIDNFNFNYLVNYAVGIRVLGELNLAEKTLYDFRSRIYQYLIKHPEQENLIFGQFIKLTETFAKEAGISTKEQRMDSTMFMSNIKKAGRIALAFDVLHRAVKSITEDKLTESLKEILKPEFKTQTIYRSKPSENESKLEMLLNLCLEAKNIIENLPGMENSDTLRILARFLSEQASYDEQTKKLKARDNKNIPTDSLQSAYDEDATYRKKGGKGESGYVLNLSETCSKQNPFQLITDYDVKQNIKSDVELIQDRLPIIKQNTDCEDLYVDGGFYSDDVVEKGITPTHAGVTNGQTVAHFPLNSCGMCELKDKCHCKKQKKDYIVRINLKSIESARQRMKVECSRKENTSVRAAIEGTNSALKRGHGLCKLKVRGLVKCSITVGFKVLAQNFKRFARYMLEQSKKVAPKTPGTSMPILSQ